ncbi:MAG: NUDIX domain-containing protein [Colwellia sp.]|nr:NUDIX domain-containing protein [Colwellia sp.]MCW9080025.1 NUDIX domain-containing protein [Colwellia sp.]
MQDSKNKSPVMLQYHKEDANVVALETKYRGFFKLNEYQLNHKLFSGGQSQTFTREVFERGDAVVVILYDVAEDKLLLLEQFRAGAIRAGNTPWMLEFVAGMFDENETPEEVAIRETQEEANIEITADSLSPIMTYLSSPGGMSECIHLYLAKFDSTQVVTGSVFGLDEENEDILLHLVSRTQALALLAQGKISNAATVIGLQWLALNYQCL